MWTVDMHMFNIVVFHTRKLVNINSYKQFVNLPYGYSIIMIVSSSGWIIEDAQNSCTLRILFCPLTICDYGNYQTILLNDE